MQSPSRNPSTIKKTKIKNASKPQMNETRTGRNTSAYISTFYLLIFTLLIYDFIVSDRGVDFELVTIEVLNSVHNQNEAVDVIVETLNTIQKHERSVNLNFVGSSGVGKTFIANILKKHFHPSVYELNGVHKPSDFEELLDRFRGTSSKYNLIILDDLTVADVESLLFFIERIPQEIVVLVVSVFNIQETDDKLNYKINYDHINEIMEKFKSANVPHEVVKFQEFTKDQVHDWIVKHLRMKGVDLQTDSKLVEAILSDQNIKYHGLKGLSSKLNLQL